MLGSSLLSGNSGSPAKNRVFVYEVSGLKQSETNDSNNYQFRSSSSVFVQVPYDRMNAEMQRIGKMGGTIVNIYPLESFQQSDSTIEVVNSDSEEE
ncbi:MAG: phycobilisome linker polypeptide [Cyanobacteria bacterium P01_G01_bin.19]